MSSGEQDVFPSDGPLGAVKSSQDIEQSFYALISAVNNEMTGQNRHNVIIC